MTQSGGIFSCESAHDDSVMWEAEQSHLQRPHERHRRRECQLAILRISRKGAKLGSSFLGAFLCVFAPLREKIPLDTAFQ
jgi:hypothetical protein